MPVPQPHARLLNIEPYIGGESKTRQEGRIVKLSSNEGPFGPSPMAQKAYSAMASELYRYSDGAAVLLRQTLADVWGLDRDKIVCGCGSDELLFLLAHGYAGPGDEIIFSEYSFLMYPIYCHSVGATPVEVPAPDKSVDVDGILNAVTDKTKLVYIANPNNPTGSLMPKDEVIRLHAGLPDHVLLVLDCAYAEYMKAEDDYTSGAHLVDKFDNVVMTRTFSKMFALAGMRLGWAYCPPAVADVLNRIRQPFNTTLGAQAAAVAALRDTDFLIMCRDHTRQWRQWTYDKLLELGYKAYPAWANYILFEVGPEGTDAEICRQYLKSKNVILRQMNAYRLPHCLRVSIGTAEEMQIFIDTLAGFER